MPRNNNNNTLKQVAAFLLVIILLAVIGVGTWIGVVTNGFRDWSGFTGPSEPAEGEQVSGVTDGDGNEMQSGESYALPAAMVYAVPTAQSATASEGITVTATVLPETAVNKNVMWAVRFANASSEWATGKTASDYVTVTPDAENSRIATVVCNEAFGEQIILTVASAADPTKMASCTIDYAQSITDVSVKIGNIDVNLGGETEVTVDVGHNNIDRGGVIAIEYTMSEVYTIAVDADFTETLSFITDDVDKDNFTQTYPSGTTSSTYHNDAIEDAEGKTLYFDQRMFDAYNFSYTSANYAAGDYTGTTTYFRDLDVSRIESIFSTTGYCRDKVLWTVQLNIASEYQTISLESDIIWASIDGYTEVTGVTLDPTEIVFSGSVSE